CRERGELRAIAPKDHDVGAAVGDCVMARQDPDDVVDADPRRDRLDAVHLAISESCKLTVSNLKQQSWGGCTVIGKGKRGASGGPPRDCQCWAGLIKPRRVPGRRKDEARLEEPKQPRVERSLERGLTARTRAHGEPALTAHDEVATLW